MLMFNHKEHEGYTEFLEEEINPITARGRIDF
jgi:hypothetical protein